jgi:ribosome-binding factor A
VWPDETDPRRFFGGAGRDRGDERKLRQLCRQVERAVATSLAADCADEDLAGVWVAEVTPAPDARRLAVTVLVRAADDVDLERVRTALRGASPLVRSRIASEIHRKRVPEIAFDVRLDEEVDRG